MSKRHAAITVAAGESQTRAYRLMGAPEWCKGSFETEAALEAGRTVAQELKARR